ncbi:MAG: hypothetical protein ACKO23_10575 [Gemmataceae bacterium]
MTDTCIPMSFYKLTPYPDGDPGHFRGLRITATAVPPGDHHLEEKESPPQESPWAIPATSQAMKGPLPFHHDKGMGIILLF